MLLYFKKHNNINMVDKVNDGVKIHTCRNKRVPKIGEQLFLRCGKSSSRQVCVSSQDVKINNGVVIINNKTVDTNLFAKNGGFCSKSDITEFYGVQYRGFIIHFTNFLY